MNVVVVVANGLQCHWLGPYGNEWVSTPAVDALAVESVVFDQHYADDLSVGGSFASRPPTLIDRLHKHGVFAVHIDDRRVGSTPIDSWDQVVRTDRVERPTPGDALIFAVESALDHLANRSPWLLWVETDRLLPPWDFDAETYQHYAAATTEFVAEQPLTTPPDGHLAPGDDALWHRLHNSFAAAVTSLDAEIDVLSEVFRERGLDRSAAWILTSGYGSPLGEHGPIGPARSRLHKELVHLPLIVRLPGGSQALRRVPGFSQSADLPPTVLDLFGIEAGPSSRARSVLPLATGHATASRAYVASQAGRATHTERAIRTQEWTFLPAVPQTGEPPRLYRRPDDLWEVNDVAARHPDECDRLAALLDSNVPAQEPIS